MRRMHFNTIAVECFSSMHCMMPQQAAEGCKMSNYLLNKYIRLFYEASGADLYYKGC